MGVAIALTVICEPRLRVLVGVILAIGAAVVFTLTNITPIQVAYIVAVGWWWLVQLVGTARLTAPRLLPARPSIPAPSCGYGT